MPLDVVLLEPHRLFVELVWAPFRDSGGWPRSKAIENALRRRLDRKTNTYDVFRTLPSVIGWAQTGADLEARLTPIAMAVVVPAESQQTLRDFFQAFEVCRQRYLEAADDAEVHLSSGDLGALAFDELRIRRTQVLLRDRNLLTGSATTWQTDTDQQYGWELAIYPPVINHFREVTTLVEYLVELREEINSMTGSPGFVPEDTAIEPIKPVRFTPSLVTPPTEITHRDIHIYIEGGSTVGNIVWDSIVSNIESNINASTGVSGEELGEALKAVTEACAADPELEASQQQEALELIEYLSEAATLPEQQRRRSVIRAAVTGVGTIMTLATQASQVWTQWAPMIEQVFHLGTHSG